MKPKYLIVLTLVVLLVAGCKSQTAVPTSTAETAATEETPVAITGNTATPGTEQTVTTPVTPPGGVDVALAAIEPIEGTLATVNGQEINWADFEPELNQSLHSVTLQYGVDWNQAENIDLLAQFQDSVLQTVIDRTLLRQSAANEGITASQEAIQARVDDQNAAILESGQFTTWDEFLEQFGLSQEYFARLMEDAVLIDQVSEAHAPSREAEQVHARHILVTDEETSEQVIARLEEGEEWATLASELSIDLSNKDSEGDLGWFPRGVMVAEFEEAAFSLEPGTTSAPVQTDYGYHIIQVLEKGVRDLDDEVYESLASQEFQAWLDAHREAADITIAVTFGATE